MSRFQRFQRDDRDDTQLFGRLEEYVLEHYPNPQRVGCLDPETLKNFVETPEKLDTSDPKYLHIIQCRECTKDLIELRRIREEHRQREVDDAPTTPSGFRETIRNWSQRLATAFTRAGVTVDWFMNRYQHRSQSRAIHAHSEGPVFESIDLSSQAPMAIGHGCLSQHMALPRRLIHLHLVLPRGSPAGTYHILVDREKQMEQIPADASACATVSDDRTELNIMLDLRQNEPGVHFLVLVRVGDATSNSYEFLLT